MLTTSASLSPSEQKRAAGTLVMVQPHMTVLATEDPTRADDTVVDEADSDGSISSQDMTLDD